MKDVLTEAMDIEGLRTFCGTLVTAAIRCVAVDTPVPSQFSHEILNANPYAYLDDAPLEAARARRWRCAASCRKRYCPKSALDPAAIDEVVALMRGPMCGMPMSCTMSC